MRDMDNIYSLHLLSLILERDGQLEASLESLTHLSEVLERQYEDTEDEELLRKFCAVKSDIGRVSLGLGDFEAAVENGSTALDLSQDLQGLERARLSSQITVSLSYYFLGEMDNAIDMFQAVLAESDEDVDVMLLIACALWGTGGERERSIAVEQIQDWFDTFLDCK